MTNALDGLFTDFLVLMGVLAWMYMLASFGISENKQGVNVPNAKGYVLLALMYILIGAAREHIQKCG